MKTNEIKKWQQGDVIIKSTSIPKKEWGKKVNHLILQKSDISQHCHKIDKGSAIMYSSNKVDEFFIDAKTDIIITHEEHKKIKLPKGKYFAYGVKEFDPFEEEIRRIRD